MTKTFGLSKRQVSRGRTPDGEPNPIDVHVGKRLRLRRELLGMSQEMLGGLLGVTFQQVQKYERGTNRMGSSRLWDIAQVLDVGIDFFFDDMPSEIAEQSPRCFALSGGMSEAEKADVMSVADPMKTTESYELLFDYYRINNRNLARALKDSIHEAAK